MNESAIADLWIQWSIRASCALVYVRLLYRLGSRRGIPRSPGRLERGLWVLAFLLFALHVCLAFHHIHQWQHNNAWQRTAVETESLMGVRRGDGIWANYLMLLIWGFDVVRVHRASRSHLATSARIDRLVGWFIGFMFFNATFVFGPVFYRYLFLPAVALPFFIWLCPLKARK